MVVQGQDSIQQQQLGLGVLHSFMSSVATDNIYLVLKGGSKSIMQMQIMRAVEVPD